jgi:GMP synthase-like glutamine amidotransferase
VIAVEAKARGLCLDVRHLDQGASIPDSDQVNGLVVMGGPMGAYETDKYPFLTEECRLLRELAHRNCPVLGICLGSQLLAKALGADVFPGPGPEIGFGFVELTQAGKQDPLFATVGSSIPVFHWHGDTFDLPEGAVLLASNKEYAQQAFRFGSCAYGLQFHIEPDSGTWLDWQEHLPIERSDNTGPQKERIEQLGRRMIERFFDAVL